MFKGETSDLPLMKTLYFESSECNIDILGEKLGFCQPGFVKHIGPISQPKSRLGFNVISNGNLV